MSLFHFLVFSSAVIHIHPFSLSSSSALFSRFAPTIPSHPHPNPNQNYRQHPPPQELTKSRISENARRGEPGTWGGGEVVACGWMGSFSPSRLVKRFSTDLFWSHLTSYTISVSKFLCILEDLPAFRISSACVVTVVSLSQSQSQRFWVSPFSASSASSASSAGGAF